jgi:hypothetical protein
MAKTRHDLELSAGKLLSQLAGALSRRDSVAGAVNPQCRQGPARQLIGGRDVFEAAQQVHRIVGARPRQHL